jgi:Ca2+-dependent lipid-binding protein
LDYLHSIAVGATDGYVSIRFSGQPPQKTRVIRNNSDPQWSTELRIPVFHPVMSDDIIIELFDYNQVGYFEGKYNYNYFHIL